MSKSLPRMTLITGYILAGCIGLSLGLIGGGGSILAVSILIYVCYGNSIQSCDRQTIRIVILRKNQQQRISK